MKESYSVTKNNKKLVFLLLLQLGLTTAFQPPQQQQQQQILSRHRRRTRYPWSYISAAASGAALVDETNEEVEVEATQISFSSPHAWDEQFEILQSFQKKYGHWNFPQNPPEALEKEYPTLVSFCHHQRVEYKKTKRSTTNHWSTLRLFDRNLRCQHLKELGFEFNAHVAKWYDKYHELLQYRNDNHGRIYVPVPETKGEGEAEQHHGNNNRSLYRWAKVQRARKRRNKAYEELSDTQVELLDRIGFEWESERYDVLWMEKYNELVDFRKKHGHCMVKPGGKLYLWMKEQRSRREQKHYRLFPLSNEQLRLLDKIEFPWKPELRDSRWNAKYKELEEFQKKHGHCQPTKSPDRTLYDWSRVQRKKRETGVLPTHQIQLLDKIDFPWELKRVTFRLMVAKLMTYYHQHGHLRVSQDDEDDDDDSELYEWMALQRKRYHGMVTVSGSPMTDEQIEKMEETNFCWSQDWKERVWHEKYTKVVEFYKEHGHVHVKKKDYPSIYNWIQVQEERYKGTEGYKPLSEEESELLEQIDFAFFENRPRMSWNTMYAEVERYREENDGRFPNHRDDPELSRWMRQQRKRLRSSYGHVPLSDEQASMLKSIDFPMLPKGFDLRSWCERYDELVDFWKHHGHFLVDRFENPRLYKWIAVQRSTHDVAFSYTRPPSRSEKYLLDRIGFPWTSDRYELEWQKIYEELVQFQQETGHLQPKVADYPSLYSWMWYQRERYQNKELSGMPTHQIDQLNKIGFRWTV
ncbi:unnamed protein product [Cylindrotheca closterium]|uniref:Helicase-associated domain-containing protein n=1 Tax=Cylindrotheca closterium TaxID=2856 RepID=A0AAD2FM75_9STRA|nr:unnamed protein product [Cylindrotheca closterium]